MRHGRSVLITLIATVTFSPHAVAEGSCVRGTQPAATLLFPYFEIDPAAETSLTTLISIGSVSEEPTLANVVIWTNCGIPVLAFTLYLGGDALQSLDLRKVIVDGQIPVTGPGGAANPFPSCADPLSQPILDADALARLRARLSGQPSPDDGRCYAHPTETPSLISGYLTVDVLNDCSETIHTVYDDGYFASGGQGLASNRNVLWGDFFLIDGDADTAKGFEAVSVVADASVFTDPSITSFYASGDGDDRLPLSSRYRTRFLNGGGFDGGTEVIVWAQQLGLYRGSYQPPCETGCQGLIGIRAFARTRDEQGTELATESFYPRHFPIKLRVGSEHLPVDGGLFGSLQLGFDGNCSICSPPYFGPIQGWVMPLHSASGRFGVGLNAVRLNDFCE